MNQLDLPTGIGKAVQHTKASGVLCAIQSLRRSLMQNEDTAQTSVSLVREQESQVNLNSGKVKMLVIELYIHGSLAGVVGRNIANTVILQTRTKLTNGLIKATNTNAN